MSMSIQGEEVIKHITIFSKEWIEYFLKEISKIQLSKHPIYKVTQ